MACRQLLCLFVIHLFLFVQCDAYSYASSTATAISTSYGGKKPPGNKCGVNEVFSTCSQALCRAKKCSELNKPIKCPRVAPECCIKECVCKEGYLKDKNGTCIPQNKCELQCGENEVVDQCPSNCASENCPTSYCDTKEVCNPPKSCPPPKCKCAFNHRRAENGTCIPTRQCPPFDCSAFPNEEYNPCPPRCPTDDCSQASPTGECPKSFGRIGIINICQPTCRCIKGYWRKDGICVPYEQCPKPLSCGPNEKPKCVKECPPEGTCRNRGVAVSCLDDGKPCEQKCVCKEGYYRNAVGDCITNAECDKCTGDHEYFACGGACDNVCTELYRKSKAKCDIVNIKCNPMCYCEDGYARDGNGTCVAIADCPKNPTCSDSEVVDSCPVECPTDNCPANEEQTKIKSCPKPDVCPPATCKCRFNYRRADNGTCIPTRECPPLQCSGANEKYNSCPTYCPGEQCSQATKDGKCHIKGKIGTVVNCFPRCTCMKNYYRRDGKCVPYAECKKCPGPHEVFTGEKKSCPPDTCMSIVAKFKCDANQEEFSGCVCESGYLRINGTKSRCVPTCECKEMAGTVDCQKKILRKKLLIN